MHPNTAQSPRKLHRYLCALLLALASTACGALLTGSSDPTAVKTIMESTSARGCIAHRNHTEQFLRSDTYVIGTWGTPSPELAECIRAWQGVLQ